MRFELDKDVSILTQRGKPLTLKALRELEESQLDLFDWGGCGCFAD